jgi:hypothetical protein
VSLKSNHLDLALVQYIIIYHNDFILKFFETIKLKHVQVLPQKMQTLAFHPPGSVAKRQKMNLHTLK